MARPARPACVVKRDPPFTASGRRGRQENGSLRATYAPSASLPTGSSNAAAARYSGSSPPTSLTRRRLALRSSRDLGLMCRDGLPRKGVKASVSARVGAAGPATLTAPAAGRCRARHRPTAADEDLSERGNTASGGWGTGLSGPDAGSCPLAGLARCFPFGIATTVRLRRLIKMEPSMGCAEMSVVGLPFHAHLLRTPPLS